MQCAVCNWQFAMCAVYTLRPAPIRGAHHNIVAQHNVSRKSLSTGTWCSGITPAQHAGGPGVNPQRVHMYHCCVRMRLWSHLAALSVQGTMCNMQCAMSSLQSAVRGVQLAVCNVCGVYTPPCPLRGAHHSIVAKYNVSRKTLSTGTWCSGITPAQHAGGPGFNLQRVHIYHCCVQMTLWNHLAALSVQGTMCNMQCAMSSVQYAVRGVQLAVCNVCGVYTPPCPPSRGPSQYCRARQCQPEDLVIGHMGSGEF